MDKINFLVENLSASYRKFSIKNANFELKNGDILGLIGKSGSGKSTLIKTLMGLKKPDKGKIRITINDKNTSINSVVGYSPQSNSLYPYLSLDENLKIFGKLYNCSDKQIKERSRFFLTKLKLMDSRKKKIIQLSGGMQKRADIAVALIHSPKIIILDEPFNGLDVSLQQFLWNFFKSLSQEGNIIIITSHIIPDLERYCNEFGLISDGKYYNTSQIHRTIKMSHEHSLFSYIKKLFAHQENIAD